MEAVRETLRTHHYSYRTEETYLKWIRRFILFNGQRHPREMGAPEIQGFLSDLAVRGHAQGDGLRGHFCRASPVPPAGYVVGHRGMAGSGNEISHCDIASVTWTL